MAQNYTVWLLEGNRKLFLDSASYMVHDGNGHNLYQYRDGRLTDLSGGKSLLINEDGRILNSDGTQVGFVNDYRVFRNNAAAARKKAGYGASAGVSGGTGNAGSPKPARRKGRITSLLFIIMVVGLILIFAQSKPTPQKPVYGDINEAVLRLRKAFVDYEDSITLTYRTKYWPKLSAIEDYRELLSSYQDHTGNPNEGDTLAMTTAISEGSSSSEKLDQGYAITVNLRLFHYTTKAQEEQLRAKIRTIISGLNLAGKSDYDKILAIYRWICANVTYDYDHLNDTTYKLQYTAYSAAINGTSVCAGYAELFYRLALSAGLEARIKINNNHAWNLVKLGDQYYYCDTTWDSGKTPDQYQYFLRGRFDFGEHSEGTFSWGDHYLNDHLKTLDRWLTVSDYKYTAMSP